MLQLDRTKHFIRETPVAQFLRREFRDPDIVTYWDAERSAWVFGCWLWKDKGIVDDLDDIGTSYEAGPTLTRAQVTRYRAWHRPPDYKAHRRRVVEKARAEIRQRLDEQMELCDMARYVRKRTQRPFLFQA